MQISVTVFEAEVLPFLHHPNVCLLAMTLFYANYDHSWFTCEEHKSVVFDILFRRLGQLLVRRQCKRINLSLSLKEQDLDDANKKAQQQGLSK